MCSRSGQVPKHTADYIVNDPEVDNPQALHKALPLRHRGVSTATDKVTNLVEVHEDSLLAATEPSGSGGVPREQTMLKGHLLRVIYHQVY